MNKPITIPCILILNHEEIAKAEDLGTTPPEEYRVEHELKFFTIDILETPFAKPKGHNINVVTYIYSNGRVFSSTLKESEIESRMIEAGWYD